MAVQTAAAFVCKDCGTVHRKWQGQCKGCSAWSSLVEENITTNRLKQGYSGSAAQLVNLSDVDLKTTPRIKTGLSEFDLVLGGGLVVGSVVLLGGNPGIGKSTLLLQVSANLLSDTERVMYVSGEESPQQIALTASRLQLNCKDLPLLPEVEVEKIIDRARSVKPTVLVIDSIQTIFTASLTAAPGSVSQVRDSAAALVRFAKQHNITILMIGHVTKDGALAGPRVLEHMVDTVLYFESQTDSRYRAIRAVKNRFGAAGALGIFAMTELGLRVVDNPSAIFLSSTAAQNPGSQIMVSWEGTRPLLIEIQALLDESKLANPRRLSVGLEQNRLGMLLAVMHRHAGIACHGMDVFMNVVGGMRVTETAADLPVLLAVWSSLRAAALPHDRVAFGEIGLAGEIRPVPYGQERLQEAYKQGFKSAIIPKANAPKRVPSGMRIDVVEHLDAVMELLRE